MLAPGMNNPVFVIQFCTVDYVVGLLVCGKTETCLGDPGSIIRMYVAIHIVVHQVITLFPAIAVQFAEPFRKNKGDDTLIYELVDGERDRGTLHVLYYCFIILISFHDEPPFTQSFSYNIIKLFSFILYKF